MLYLDKKAVRDALPMADAVDAMKRAFKSLTDGDAVVPARTAVAVPEHEGDLLFMPSHSPAEGHAAVKVVTLFKRNRAKGIPFIQAMVLVFSATDGSPVGILDGTILTALRTGAASGAATDVLARPDARSVAVFGAGNVAMDSARTAMRLGADTVRIVYRRSRDEMPARAAEIHHAEEEGIEFYLLTAPTRFLGDENGRVTGMECIEMELGEPDESGRRRPVPIEGSKFKLECDLAVIAVGAGANPLLTQATEDLELNKWGYIVADPETGKTTKKGVWAGGDIVTGSATVILAMGAGRIASDSMHKYLSLGW